MPVSIDDRLLSDMQKLLIEQMSSCKSDLDILCESPIEVALGTAMLISWRLEGDGFGLAAPLIMVLDEEIDNHLARPGGQAAIVPQYKSRGFRHDFAIFHPDIKTPVIIECDGHEFHERTKEQAKRDRSRDREIQRRGAVVLRFTGSEIFASPYKAACEVMNHISIALIHGHTR